MNQRHDAAFRRTSRTWNDTGHRRWSGLTLSPVRLSDRPVFEAAFARLDDPISDATFAACFMWGETLGSVWSVIEGHLCLFSTVGDDLCLILPPLAVRDGAAARLDACLRTSFDLMDEHNAGRVGRERSRIEYVSDEVLDRLRAASAMTLSVEPMHYDYVYPSHAMISLEGGPLKNKRKLRNGFERERPHARTDELRPEHVAACLELLERWKARADEAREGETNDRFVDAEELRRHDLAAASKAITHARELRLETMTLWDGDRLIGFTLGERLGSRAAVVYVEKTDPEVRGAAQFLFSEFCRQRFADCEEINAGDDWGLPNLRFTKTSYRPTRLIAKSVLTRQAAVSADVVEPAALAAIAASTRPHRADSGGQEEGGGAVSDHGGFVLRPARPDDAPAICRIEQRAFEHAEERFTLRQARRLLVNPRAAALVAERAGEAAGWGLVLTRRTRAGLAGRLYAIAVAPEQTGRGVGRALAQALLGELSARGVTRVYLEVRQDNAAAIALYRSLGFETVAELPGYYGPGVDAMRMRRVAP